LGVRSNGVILRSLDEGKTGSACTWQAETPSTFAASVAFNASTAYIMSSGEGEKSRIYKTTDAAKRGNRNNRQTQGVLSRLHRLPL